MALNAASKTKAICTTTDPAGLAPPPTVTGALELDVGLDEVRVVDGRVPDAVSSSPGESKDISWDVGPGASELPNAVTKGVDGVAVGLGTASIRLARVVASAGVENVMVLLSSANMADAAPSSVAVVV